MITPTLQPSRAPGRDATGAPPAPEAPAAPAEPGQASEGAPQDAPPPGGLFGGPLGMFAMIGVVVLMFWWMNRSEKKRRVELENKLKKGDKVLTRSGFIGKIVEIGDTRARVELAPGVVVPIIKTAIEGLADADAEKSDKAGKSDNSGDKDKEKSSDSDKKKKKK